MELKDLSSEIEIIARKTGRFIMKESRRFDNARIESRRFDAFFEYGLNPWDVAAGTLMIHEALGRVSDFSGNEIDVTGKEIIAANTLYILNFSKL